MPFMVARTARKPPKFHPYLGKDICWLLDMQAQERGDRTFLIWQPPEDDAVRWTYREFAERVDAVTRSLIMRGVREADPVLIHLDNCPEFLFAWFACAKIGAVAVTTNTRSSADELSYFIDHARVRFAVTQQSLLPLVEGCGPELGWIACVGLDAAQHGAFPFEDLYAPEVGVLLPYHDPLTPVSVQYTSGTTSRPKGVVWTHANALWAAQINARHCELRETDVGLIILPLFHTNALGYSVLGTLWAGGSVVLTPKFSRRRFWDISTRNGCTWASLFPFVATALQDVETPEHCFRFWAIGLADVPAFEEKFRLKIAGWWGMTETVSHPIQSYLHLRGMPGAMGVPAPEYEIDVRGEDGNSVEPTEDGAAGRLFIRGVPGISLFLEYLNDPEATDGCFDANGWMDTGDIVNVRSDGQLIFGDRAKDMLKVGGENVAASEIERVVVAMDEVAEAAVVGKAHDFLGEVPVVFVIPSGSVVSGLEEKVRARCESLLADFKVPREVILTDALPRSLMNKVAKKELRERLEGL
ncbi:ATP-dependent acyl-CoA ligase [Sphingosinicella microcystinivorans]|uniref:ATP-dependent acyl-CoA ligase n=2 Tax=Sphingosinicella microcystinivorans TaxID=335406 RepID=A0AAD1D3K7_SPHMI|nr:ATP-dependent acyl-CoA ligase [Sphingosinicella microcystinivorans]